MNYYDILIVVFYIYCRPYVVNLVPCISKLCLREEEAIQETLQTAMKKICPVLMGFSNDQEVKVSVIHKL